MKQILRVESKKYDIIISDDSVRRLGEELRTYTSGQKRLVVISKKVYELYKDELGFDEAEYFVLNDGEREKNFKNYIRILESASKRGFTRSDVIVAIGGGVVGDIAGFAASTYMRGVGYIQVPTTLLAMVDSSVGGKTAVDLDGYKNTVGTFYQPKRVYINIAFLNTLDRRQYSSGLAEVLKYAFIEENCGYGKPLFLFEYLSLCAERLQEREVITLGRVIEYCLRLKIAVVEKDEKERDLRRVLNFGHTYGHALESLGGFRKYTHGEAVVQGIFFVLKWAYDEGDISYSYYRLSVELLEKYGFAEERMRYKPEKVLEVMKRDKKSLNSKLVFILPLEKRHSRIVKVSLKEALAKLNSSYLK